jgi:hypothetical protein
MRLSSIYGLRGDDAKQVQYIQNDIRLLDMIISNDIKMIIYENMF